ncbi:hypothetical protein A0O36_02818 [Piscirickettsiaceae bacterium NZ-RLO1]|nr:hypothetical protein A0O36_02818 [Piscirickettsiaceae bacterium NZ-RLO1]
MVLSRLKNGWMLSKGGKGTVNYKRIKRNGDLQVEQKVISEYIRHQTHHPENTHNKSYSNHELKESINSMREFIQEQSNKERLV